MGNLHVYVFSFFFMTLFQFGRISSFNSLSQVHLLAKKFRLFRPTQGDVRIDGAELENFRIKQAIDNCRSKWSLNQNDYDMPFKIGLLTLQLQPAFDPISDLEALRYFKEAVRLNPACDGAWYNIAMILERRQQAVSKDLQDEHTEYVHNTDNDAIITSYTKAIQSTSNPQIKSASYNNIVRYLMSEGQMDEAAKMCDEAVNDNPSDPFAWSNMGIIMVQNEAFEWAEVCFQNALRNSDNSNIIALNNLAFLAKRTDNLDEAEMYFRAAVELDPSDVSSFYGLGTLLLENEDLVQAKQVFERCLENNPDDEQAALQLQTLKYSEQSKLGENGNLSPSPSSSFPVEYIKQLFDFYAAAGYEEHMVKGLQYRGPEIVLDTFIRASNLLGSDQGSENRDYFAVDIGCGTGLVGKLLRAQLPNLQALIGCDLSNEMVQICREARCPIIPSLAAAAVGGDEVVAVSDSRTVYDSVVAEDCVGFLRSLVIARKASAASETARLMDRTLCPWNLVFASDVFGYVGDLDATFSAVKDVLVAGGLFVFNVEALAENQTDVPAECLENAPSQYFKLTSVGRFAHSRLYIEALAAKYSLKLRLCESVILRFQNQEPVYGLAFALENASV